MKSFQFDKEKYGYSLQMDLGIIEKTPQFFFSEEVHCADFFEIMIFVKGNGFILLDTEKIEITNSLFLFISPQQKRRWFVNRKKIEGFFLIFEKDFLNEFFMDKLFVYRLQYFYNRQIKPYFIPNKRLFAYEKDVFEEITQEINNFQKDSPDLLRAMLFYMLVKMNRAFCEYHQLTNDTQLDNYAYSFKEILEKNIRQKQQVSDYAQLLGISRISLNTAVKKQFGVTATEMIKERLLFEIKSELLYSTKNISEIAFGLHFSEPNNMIRFFKAKVGVSPSKYRNSHPVNK